MVPGNLIQPVTVIFAIPGTVVTGAQENLVGLVTGLLKQLEVSLSLIFLLISNLFNMLHLYQFLGTKTTEANKSLKAESTNKITNEQKD